MYIRPHCVVIPTLSDSVGLGHVYSLFELLRPPLSKSSSSESLPTSLKARSKLAQAGCWPPVGPARRHVKSEARAGAMASQAEHAGLPAAASRAQQHLQPTVRPESDSLRSLDENPSSASRAMELDGRPQWLTAAASSC